MDTTSPSRLRSARLASMETVRYNADGSGIGKVTSRSERLASAASASTPLTAAPLGSVASPSSAATSAPRFTSVPPATAKSAAARAAKASDKNRKPSLVDRLQERVANANRGLLVLAAIVITLVVSVVALYGPLRDYYVARRSNEYLSVQLEALTSANESVQQELEALQTREGIEDEARRRGYIEEGSNAVNVTGLPDDSDSRRGENGSVFTEVKEVETHWYTGILDALFGYTPPEL